MAIQDNRLQWQEDIARLEAEIEQIQLGEIPELDEIGDRVTTLEGQIVSVSGELAQEILDRQSADTSLTNEIARVESDFAVDVQDLQAQDLVLAGDISSVSTAIAQEILDRQASDLDLSSEITRVEDDLTQTVQDLDTELSQDISNLQSALAQEIDDREDAVSQEALARQAGDASTLSSAQSYADQKIADLIDSAPAVLDTLKEIADALNSDPNFAGTITGQISAIDDRVDQEILDRQAADVSVLDAAEAYADLAVSAEQTARISADQNLQDQIDDIESLESDVRSDLDDLEAYTYDVRSDLDQEVLDRQAADTLIQSGITSLDGRLDVVEPKVTTLESEMDAVQSDVVSLDGRLDVVEPKVTTLESNVSILQSDVVSLDSRLDIAEPKISTLQSDVSTLQSDVVSLDGRLDVAEPKVTALESSVSILQSDVSTLESDVAAIEDSVGQAGGLVPLNGSGLIDSQFLPSYVDDVLEFANILSFPVPGETGKIFVALDNGKCFRWTGSQYIEISSSEVNSVNGQVGVVSLDAADIQMVSEVKSIEQKLIDLSNADISLDGRLDIIEPKVTTLEGNVADLQSDMSQAQSDIVSLQAETADLEAYADSIQSEVDDLEAFSDGNATDLDALTARVTALEAEAHFVPHTMSVTIASSTEQQYVDCAHLANVASLNVHVDAMKAHYLRDFSVLVVGGKTRITWINTFAVGGIEAVAIGEVAYLSYAYEV
jgi:chromosome segregation ATPase